MQHLHGLECECPAGSAGGCFVLLHLLHLGGSTGWLQDGPLKHMPFSALGPCPAQAMPAGDADVEDLSEHQQRAKPASSHP